PFGKVVEAVLKHRDRDQSPLFNIKFGLHNLPEVERLDLGNGVNLTPIDLNTDTTQIDISLDISASSQGLLASLTYCRDLYKPETIDRMAVHYVELLRSITADAEQTVSELRMLTEEEERRLLE